MAEQHEKLLMEDSCFHNSTVHPFIGASPDSVVECPGECFHYGFVYLENASEGKWYCPECRKLPTLKRKCSIRN